MKTTRKNYKDEFMKSLLCDDPKSLVKTWHERSNDRFYAILSNIKEMVDNEFINDSNETNPILYAMLAYCFDGDKKKTYEKVHKIVTAYCVENDFPFKYHKIFDELVALDNEADDCAPKEIFDIDEQIPISTYYDFVLSGFDPYFGITGKDIRVEVEDEDIQIYFDAYANDEDMAWLKETLFKCDEDTEDYKSYNLVISLKPKENDEYYDLVYFTDAMPLGYVDQNKDNGIVTIVFRSNMHYFATESNDAIANAIQKTIEQRLSFAIDPDDECCDCKDCYEDEDIDLVETSTTLDMSNVRDLNFVLSGYYNDDAIEFYRMKLSYTNMSDFRIELSKIIGDEETKNFHKTLLMPLETLPTKRGYVSKSTVVHDMRIDLYDSQDGKVYNILNLKNAYVASYDNDTIKIVSDTFFIADQDKDQVANYARAQLSGVLTDVYRDNGTHGRAWIEYA